MSWLSKAVGAQSKRIGGYIDAYTGKSQAESQRNWEERMSNTSYQRSMADMKKAGLNPILAYQKGGASTPGVGMAPPVSKAAESAVSSAVQMRRMSADVKLTEATTRKTDAETRITEDFGKHWAGKLIDTMNKIFNLEGPASAEGVKNINKPKEKLNFSLPVRPGVPREYTKEEKKGWKEIEKLEAFEKSKGRKFHKARATIMKRYKLREERRKKYDRSR